MREESYANAQNKIDLGLYKTVFIHIIYRMKGGFFERLRDRFFGVSLAQHIANVDEADQAFERAKTDVRQQITPKVLSELGEALKNSISPYTEKVRR